MCLCNLKPQQDGKRKSTFSTSETNMQSSVTVYTGVQLDQHNCFSMGAILWGLNFAIVSETAVRVRIHLVVKKIKTVFTLPAECHVKTCLQSSGLVMSLLELNPDKHTQCHWIWVRAGLENKWQTWKWTAVALSSQTDKMHASDRFPPLIMRELTPHVLEVKRQWKKP